MGGLDIGGVVKRGWFPNVPNLASKAKVSRRTPKENSGRINSCNMVSICVSEDALDFSLLVKGIYHWKHRYLFQGSKQMEEPTLLRGGDFHTSDPDFH